MENKKKSDVDDLNKKAKEFRVAVFSDRKYILYNLCKFSFKKSIEERYSEKETRNYIQRRMKKIADEFHGKPDSVVIEKQTDVAVWTHLKYKHPKRSISVFWIKEIAYMKPNVNGTWGFNPLSVKIRYGNESI